MKNIFPNAKIFSIEPDIDNNRQLKKNIEGYNDIIAINAGLWGQNTNLKVSNKDNGNWGITVCEDRLNGDIPAISIDSLLKNYDIPYIDILKLDIESSEKNIFMSDCSNWLPKVRMMVIELHDFLEPGCSKQFFSSILSNYEDFSYYVSGENSIIVNNNFMK